MPKRRKYFRATVTVHTNTFTESFEAILRVGKLNSQIETLRAGWTDPSTRFVIEFPRDPV